MRTHNNSMQHTIQHAHTPHYSVHTLQQHVTHNNSIYNSTTACAHSNNSMRAQHNNSKRTHHTSMGIQMQHTHTTQHKTYPQAVGKHPVGLHVKIRLLEGLRHNWAIVRVANQGCSLVGKPVHLGIHGGTH